jgi:hypothetical protein
MSSLVVGKKKDHNSLQFVSKRTNADSTAIYRSIVKLYVMCRWFRQQGNLYSVLRDVHNSGSILIHTFLCQFVHVRFNQKG